MTMRAPRVLIVMPDDWPRALLRTKLRDRGYNAIAAPSLADAFVYPVSDPEAGTIRLLVLDQAALDAEALERFTQRHRGVRVLLLAFSTGEAPPGPWAAVIRRPAQAGEVPQAIEEIVPLTPVVHRPHRD
ncbi:MAG TPA: hypothetical protein VF212_11685 [Longimicrobiales bacterium]